MIQDFWNCPSIVTLYPAPWDSRFAPKHAPAQPKVAIFSNCCTTQQEVRIRTCTNRIGNDPETYRPSMNSTSDPPNALMVPR